MKIQPKSMLPLLAGISLSIVSCDQEAASPPPTRADGNPAPDIRRDRRDAPATAPTAEGSGTRSDYKPTTGQGGRQETGQ
ncbi:MAG: hypothetical protein KF712_21840 [Akkermansiaceae bacterium]|nr:hypothetical protein [Akkermansiaceae bacterium]